MRKFTSYENIGILLGATGLGPLQSGPETSFSQITRVQSAGHSFSLDRADLNQLSYFKGVDMPVVSQATVDLTANYLLTSGQNEEAIGLCFSEDKSCLHSIYAAGATGGSRSIFLVSSNKGDNRELNLGPDLKDSVVIGIGNAFINSYSMEASVGGFPNADVSFSCSNIKFDVNDTNSSATGTCPSINFISGNFEGMPDYEISAEDFDENILPVTAIRPGDITLELDEAQFGQLLASSSTIIAVQSISIDLPIPSNELNGFGSNYIYGRKPIFPAPVSIAISLNETDFKAGNLDDIFLTDKKHSFTINIKGGESKFLYKYKVGEARLISQSYTSSIGDINTVDLQFVCDVTPLEGLFLSRDEGGGGGGEEGDCIC